VVSEIRLYVEGGGDGNDTKAWMREGLHTFLHKLVDLARSKRIKWQIIVCGPRTKAFRAFEMALATHSEVCNILLVDAEGPVHRAPKYAALLLTVSVFLQPWRGFCLDL